MMRGSGFILAIPICLISYGLSFGQDSLVVKSTFKTAFGFAINEGNSETGMGVVLSLGYKKSYWNDRLRFCTDFTVGNFLPLVMTDLRDQYYRLTTLGFLTDLDAIKGKSASIFISTGLFSNYSRGLLGTGGYQVNATHSETFHHLYYGGYLGGGVRINSAQSRFAYEFIPISLFFGNHHYVLIQLLKFGVEIKI
jgi:hypothetical protein